MKFRAASNHTPGVRTFYVRSQSRANTQYVVQHIRRAGQRRWFRDCADFKFRRLSAKRHCKHLREIATRAHEVHGVSRLALRPPLKALLAEKVQKSAGNSQ
jgi:hypothetical protein